MIENYCRFYYREIIFDDDCSVGIVSFFWFRDAHPRRSSSKEIN